MVSSVPMIVIMTVARFVRVVVVMIVVVVLSHS
jgi:hypothetical protein